jgi:hypothetical protein
MPFHIGQAVYLKAAENVLCGVTGRHFDQPRSGPYTVTRIYECGTAPHSHVRLSAEGSGLSRVDAALSAFEV